MLSQFIVLVVSSAQRTNSSDSELDYNMCLKSVLLLQPQVSATCAASHERAGIKLFDVTFPICDMDPLTCQLNKQLVVFGCCDGTYRFYVI